MSYTLENEYLSASFDGKGRLTALVNLKSGTIGNVIEKPADNSFLLVSKKGENWEDCAFGKDQDFTVKQEVNKLSFHTTKLQTRDGFNDIALTLNVSLEGEELRFYADVNNNSSDCLVTDFEYPRLGVFKRFGNEEPAFLSTWQMGQRINRIGSWLSSQGENREWGNTYSLNYAGSDCSMHWMMLCAAGQTLYTACYDEDFYTSQMRVDGSSEDTGAITLVFNINPFVKPGEQWIAPPEVLHFYQGSWHQGADLYASWASTWRKPVEKPKWTNEMLGYFLVINKQQYGDEVWHYDTLPKLWELAQAHGCDTIGLFGWYDSGHDNQYPDLQVSNSLGGAEALRTEIKKIRDNGGNVTLYQQGHLIDISSDFYRIGKGYRYQSVNRHGLPYMEQYYKSHRSSFLKNYTAKQFAIACPSCTEWRELMVTKADYIASFGASGVLFDQIGGLWSYPCFDDTHPHDKGKPSLSMTGGRRKLLSAIYKRTKEINRDYAFFTEHINDLYSAYVDFLHGMYLFPSQEGDYLASSQDKIGPVNDPALFRYIFPDIRATVRNGRPFIEQRLTNYAFVFGLAFEFECRYEADHEDILQDKWPADREYAKKVNELRRKYKTEIIAGKYVDEIPLLEHNSRIITKVFETREKYGVVFWNDSALEEELHIKVKNAKFISWADVDIESDMLPAKLAAYSIGLAIFEKEHPHV